jgi:branched-chain amino acid transport system permease protein
VTQFIQQVVAGLGDGAIYAALALALVLIYRATHVINFAQGEMGMFSTYIAWSLINHHGWSFWPAFLFTLVLSFLGGAAIHQSVIRPLQRAGELTVVMATIALLVILNGLASWIWQPDEKVLETPFIGGTWSVGSIAIPQQSVYDLGVVGACVVVLWALFNHTKLGLALRASAVDPGASRLLGVQVPWMLSIGWGLAAVLSAVAGVLAASAFFVFTPYFMQVVIVYGFAAAVLGGIDSPIGAVIGGLALGVTLNLLGTYLDVIGGHKIITPDMRLPVALGILLLIIVLRPAGLLGRAVVRRV